MRRDLKNQMGFSIINFILEFIQSIVLALSAFVLIYLLVAQPNEVKGSSMFPNFVDKEMLLTDKISYRFRQPARGDVVVFKAPAGESCAEDECEYIKRVIGVPGDKVMISGGEVYLNGERLRQDFLPDDYITEPQEYMQDDQIVEVADGQVLVFGDNRSHSRDGRAFGPIDQSLIVGRAFFKYWPPKSVGVIPTVRF